MCEVNILHTESAFAPNQYGAVEASLSHRKNTALTCRLTGLLHGASFQYTGKCHHKLPLPELNQLEISISEDTIRLPEAGVHACEGKCLRWF